MLTRIGIKSNCSRVLLSLHRNEGLTSREIERITGLRQPEVSIAIQNLIKQGWVQTLGQFHENTIKPVKNYQLIYPFEIILDYLLNENLKACNNRISVVEKIRFLTLEKKDISRL